MMAENLAEQLMLPNVPDSKSAIRISLEDGKIETSFLPIWSNELVALGRIGLSIHKARIVCKSHPQASSRISSIHPPHGDTLNDIRWTRDSIRHASEQIAHHAPFMKGEKVSCEAIDELMSAKNALDELRDLEGSKDISYPPV